MFGVARVIQPPVAGSSRFLAASLSLAAVTRPSIRTTKTSTLLTESMRVPASVSRTIRCPSLTDVGSLASPHAPSAAAITVVDRNVAVIVFISEPRGTVSTARRSAGAGFTPIVLEALARASCELHASAAAGWSDLSGAGILVLLTKRDHRLISRRRRIGFESDSDTRAVVDHGRFAR